MTAKTDLCSIALRTGTDKVTHGYTAMYDKYFSSMREKNINILEIGIYKGASLDMWANYFSDAKVFGIDDCSGGRHCNTHVNPTNEKDMSQMRLKGYKVFNADQSNRDELKGVLEGDKFDIIVDDGSHFQADQQISFGALFSTIKPGGYYAIEDVFALTKETAAPRKDWGPQRNWGLHDSVDLTDATLTVFEEFERTGKILSPYMTPEETEYVNENIKSVAIYYPGPQSTRGNLFQEKTQKAILSGPAALIFIEKA